MKPLLSRLAARLAPANEPVIVPPASLALLVVSGLFGYAITPSRGAYSDSAVVVVVMAMLVIGGCFVGSLGRQAAETAMPRIQLWVLWSGLFTLGFCAWTDPQLIIYLFRPWSIGRTAQGLMLLALVAYLPSVLGVRESRYWRWARFGVIAVLVFVAGAAVIHCSPRPYIDVWTVQQRGARAFWGGYNPYVAVAVRDTGPRVANDVPYVYPPTQVYLTLIGFLLGGDVRFTMLGSLVVAGLALRYVTGKARPGLPAILEDAPALAIWLSPKLFFVVEQAWVDPVQVMLICLLCAAWASRRPWLTAVALGVVSSAKQTMFWIVPVAALMFRMRLKHLIVAAAIGIGMVAPFAIANFGALKHANLDFLTALPPRQDALTLTNWLHRFAGIELSGNLAFGFAAIVTGLVCWRLRRRPEAFGLSLAAIYAVFFVFNRWAFANYYFLLLSLSAIGAAVALFPAGAEEQVSSTPPFTLSVGPGGPESKGQNVPEAATGTRI